MRKLTNNSYEYKFTALGKLFQINVRKSNETENSEFPIVYGYLNEPNNYVKGNLNKEIFVGKVNLDGKEFKIDLISNNQIKPKIMITENNDEYNSSEKIEFKKHLQEQADYPRGENGVLVRRILFVDTYCSMSFISRYGADTTLKVMSLFASFNKLIEDVDFNKDELPDKFNVVPSGYCHIYDDERKITTRNYKRFITEVIDTKLRVEIRPLEVFFTDTEFDAMGYAKVGIVCQTHKRNAIGFSTFGVDESFRQDYFFSHYMSEALGASSDSFYCTSVFHNDISLSHKNFDTVDLSHYISFFLSDCAIKKILDTMKARYPKETLEIDWKCLEEFQGIPVCGNYIFEDEEDCDCGGNPQSCEAAAICCDQHCKRTSPFCDPYQHDQFYFPTVNPIVTIETTARTYTEYRHPEEWTSSLRKWIYIFIIVVLLAILASIFTFCFYYPKTREFISSRTRRVGDRVRTAQQVFRKTDRAKESYGLDEGTMNTHALEVIVCVEELLIMYFEMYERSGIDVNLHRVQQEILKDIAYLIIQTVDHFEKNKRHEIIPIRITRRYLYELAARQEFPSYVITINSRIYQLVYERKLHWKRFFINSIAKILLRHNKITKPTAEQSLEVMKAAFDINQRLFESVKSAKSNKVMLTIEKYLRRRRLGEEATRPIKYEEPSYERLKPPPPRKPFTRQPSPEHTYEEMERKRRFKFPYEEEYKEPYEYVPMGVDETKEPQPSTSKGFRPLPPIVSGSLSDVDLESTPSVSRVSIDTSSGRVETTPETADLIKRLRNILRKNRMTAQMGVSHAFASLRQRIQQISCPKHLLPRTKAVPAPTRQLQTRIGERLRKKESLEESYEMREIPKPSLVLTTEERRMLAETPNPAERRQLLRQIKRRKQEEEEIELPEMKTGYDIKTRQEFCIDEDIECEEDESDSDTSVIRHKIVEAEITGAVRRREDPSEFLKKQFARATSIRDNLKMRDLQAEEIEMVALEEVYEEIDDEDETAEDEKCERLAQITQMSRTEIGIFQEIEDEYIENDQEEEETILDVLKRLREIRQLEEQLNIRRRSRSEGDISQAYRLFSPPQSYSASLPYESRNIRNIRKMQQDIELRRDREQKAAIRAEKQRIRSLPTLVREGEEIEIKPMQQQKVYKKSKPSKPRRASLPSMPFGPYPESSRSRIMRYETQV